MYVRVRAFRFVKNTPLYVCQLIHSQTNIENGNQIHSGGINVIRLQTHRDTHIPIENYFILKSVTGTKLSYPTLQNILFLKEQPDLCRVKIYNKVIPF